MIIFLGLRIIDITLHKRKIYVWWNALTRNFIFHFKAQNSSMTLTNEKKICSVLTLVGFSYIPKVWQVWHFIKHRPFIFEEWYFFSENFFSCSLLPIFTLYWYSNFPGKLVNASRQLGNTAESPTTHFTLFMTCRPANQADVACEPIWCVIWFSQITSNEDWQA